MTTRWGAASQRLDAGQADWHTACELLKIGQYERASQVLHQAQLACEEGKDAILSHLLAVACRVCLACSQCRAEREWHRQASEAADRREDELLHELQTILDLISGYRTHARPEKREGPPGTSMIEVNPPERSAPEPADRFGLWQRIQTRLGWGVSHQPLQDKRLGSPVEELNPPSVKKVKTQTISLIARGSKHNHLSLAVYCLGPFRVYQDDKQITNWPSGKGKAIFKYMLANRDRPIPKEVLMDLFWRDADPRAARNNLNVAIYGLRQAFRAVRSDFSYILFEDDHYLLNPDMAMWVDVEEFAQRYEAGRAFERSGQLVEAIREYEIADGLYQGDLFEEDLYEDWPMLWREGLKDNCLVLLDRLSRYYFEQKRYTTCIHLCQKILAKDDCREDAHRRLMRCYSRQGQRNLALRQYHRCEETLARELDVSPMQETLVLYHQIRQSEVV